MPVRIAIPLPGPFVWVSGHHRHHRAAHRSLRHTPAYWLLGGWAFEAAFWITAAIVVGVVWVSWFLLRSATGIVLLGLGSAVHWYRHHRTEHRHTDTQEDA